MDVNYKEIINIGLTITIIIFAGLIIQRFIPSILWAAIIVIATYPLYKRWLVMFGKHDNFAALSFTAILALMLIMPVSYLVTVLVQDIQVFVNYLQQINNEGGQAPMFVRQFPLIGNELVAYWNEHIGQPGNLKSVLSNIHLSLTPASYYIKQIGTDLAHRGFQLGFTLLSLFFFYRDGDKLFEQISHIGVSCLGVRWFRYAAPLPSALRSIVNGTIAVGTGVGVLMGICYAWVHFPAPTLLGFLTAFASMIPFLVPIVFIAVALILFAGGNLIAAIVVLIWGTLVMFVADHFIKPALIGGAIQLPFLAVLFGILGGVETMGLLGLFIGPLIMVLFITLWQESQGMADAS
ncbi:MAG: AI-2E family transporter [Legionella sp.]